jgi:hypothetical protein
MPMSLFGLVVALAVAADPAPASSPAVTSAPLLSYGGETADAVVTVSPYRFSIYVHPEHDLLLIQPKLFGNPPRSDQWPIGLWRQAAEQFVAPLGCGIPTVQVKTRMGSTWEASFLCPEGVDLRGLVMAQRDALKKGTPLQRPQTLPMPAAPQLPPVKTPPASADTP